MSERSDRLRPVLAYLKSWGQTDAYQRVNEAADTLDAQDTRIEELEALEGHVLSAVLADNERLAAERDALAERIEELEVVLGDERRARWVVESERDAALADVAELKAVLQGLIQMDEDGLWYAVPVQRARAALASTERDDT
jgi:hypothetical protein